MESCLRSFNRFEIHLEEYQKHRLFADLGRIQPLICKRNLQAKFNILRKQTLVLISEPKFESAITAAELNDEDSQTINNGRSQQHRGQALQRQKAYVWKHFKD